MSHFWYTKGGVICRQHRRRSKDFGEYNPKSKDFGDVVIKIWEMSLYRFSVKTAGFCSFFMHIGGGFWGMSLAMTKLFV